MYKANKANIPINGQLVDMIQLLDEMIKILNIKL